MYNQGYEEYMNSVLGNSRNNMGQMPGNQMQMQNPMITANPMQIPNVMQSQPDRYPEMQNFYVTGNPNTSQQMMQTQPNTQMQSVDEVETMYPEMYKMIFPIIVKRCEEMSGPVTEEIINRMTDDIYNMVEPEMMMETERRPEVKPDTTMMNKRNLPKESETRQFGFGRRGPLRDFIRVLLLRELIDGRFPGHRHGHRHRRPGHRPNMY